MWFWALLYLGIGYGLTEFVYWSISHRGLEAKYPYHKTLLILCGLWPLPVLYAIGSTIGKLIRGEKLDGD